MRASHSVSRMCVDAHARDPLRTLVSIGGALITLRAERTRSSLSREAAVLRGNCYSVVSDY